MSLITKLFGIKTEPAKVEVIQAPAAFNRERAEARLARLEVSMKKLASRPEKEAHKKRARLLAEAEYLRKQLGKA